MVKQIIKKCKYRFGLDDEECVGMECEHYQHVVGTDPQTGKQVDQYMCSDLLTNILLIENSGQQLRTGAAIESFRNEMVTDNKRLEGVLQLHQQPRTERVLEHAGHKD